MLEQSKDILKKRKEKNDVLRQIKETFCDPFICEIKHNIINICFSYAEEILARLLRHCTIKHLDKYRYIGTFND